MSVPASGPDSIQSSPYFAVYSSLALAVTGVATVSAARGPCRAIRCDTSGTLVTKGAAMGSSTAAMPYAAGELQMVQAVALVEAGSSGCVPITVFW